MSSLDLLILGFVSVGIFRAACGVFPLPCDSAFAYVIALLIIVNASSIEHYVSIVIRNTGGEHYPDWVAGVDCRPNGVVFNCFADVFVCLSNISVVKAEKPINGG